MGDPDGFGIRFNHASVWDVDYSIGRALSVYTDMEQMAKVRRQMMEIDHSWENTVAAYTQLYQSLR
jgi:starch synthase